MPATTGGLPAFRLARAALPVGVAAAVAAAAATTAGLRAGLLQLLSTMAESIQQADTGVSLAYSAGVAGAVEKGVKAGLAGAARGGIHTIPYVITPGLRAALDRELAENVSLSIKNFAAGRVPDLRRMVEANAVAGRRSAGLVEAIRQEMGIGRRRAAFIARQETALFVSKYKERRYRAMGVTRYRWHTSHDERVRQRHRELDRRVFSFDDPPIVDPATGRRGNPGEDFNCRCIASPILVYEGVGEDESEEWS